MYSLDAQKIAGLERAGGSVGLKVRNEAERRTGKDSKRTFLVLCITDDGWCSAACIPRVETFESKTISYSSLYPSWF